MSAQHTPGQTIVGRCVTMGSTHTGRIARVVSTPGECTARYCIDCEDGRSRIVFSEGLAADGLNDLRNALAFLDEVRAAAERGEEVTATGVYRDAREWLERAARAAIAKATGSAS